MTVPPAQARRTRTGGTRGGGCTPAIARVGCLAATSIQSRSDSSPVLALLDPFLGRLVIVGAIQIIVELAAHQIHLRDGGFGPLAGLAQPSQSRQATALLVPLGTSTYKIMV